MIGDALFPVEPWQGSEPSLEMDRLAQAESVFALANGHIGLRANLDEGEPHVIAGTYLNSYCEQRPLPCPDGGFSRPTPSRAQRPVACPGGVFSRPPPSGLAVVEARGDDRCGRQAPVRHDAGEP